MIRRSGIMGGKSLKKTKSKPRKGGVTREAEPLKDQKIDKISIKESETLPVEDKEFVKEKMKTLKESENKPEPEKSQPTVVFDHFREKLKEWADTAAIVDVQEIKDEEEKEAEGSVEKDYFVVIDFEATCFKSRKVSREEMEIIEFAAALVEKDTLDTVAEFNEFVRPVIHPALDDFATELTTITQDQVDNAFTFPTVLKQFVNWLQKYPGNKTFASWGSYDKKQLLQDCNTHDVEYPFDDEHVNIKEVFRQKRGYKRQCGVQTALGRLKMPFEGTPHRGRDDVRNIVKIMRKAW